MGTTFSTIQIQNRQNIKPEKFKEILTEYAKGNGLIPTKKDKAELVYKFSFSPDNGWITLGLSEYEEIVSKYIDKDKEYFAKTLNTCCIRTSIYDSDVLTLDLYDAQSGLTDTVEMGVYDMPEDELTIKTGNPECWKPLLKGSATWEQLSKAWYDSYVDIIGALEEMSPLLGMDPKKTCHFFDYWDKYKYDDQSVVTLYFEENQPVFITEGPPKLVCSDLSVYTAMISGQDSTEAFYKGSSSSFHNIGGPSKGLTVIILGEGIDQGEVQISDMRILKYNNLENHNDGHTIEPVTLRDIHLSDGRNVLGFELDDFEFPDGINPENRIFKGFNPKGSEILVPRKFSISFKAVTKPDAIHDLTLYAIPRDNWTGGQAIRSIRLFGSDETLKKDLDLPY